MHTVYLYKCVTFNMLVPWRQLYQLCYDCNSTPHLSAAEPSETDCCRALNLLSSTVAAVAPQHILSLFCLYSSSGLHISNIYTKSITKYALSIILQLIKNYQNTNTFTDSMQFIIIILLHPIFISDFHQSLYTQILRYLQDLKLKHHISLCL